MADIESIKKRLEEWKKQDIRTVRIKKDDKKIKKLKTKLDVKESESILDKKIKEKKKKPNKPLSVSNTKQQQIEETNMRNFLENLFKLDVNSSTNDLVLAGIKYYKNPRYKNSKGEEWVNLKEFNKFRYIILAFGEEKGVSWARPAFTRKIALLNKDLLKQFISEYLSQSHKYTEYYNEWENEGDHREFIMNAMQEQEDNERKNLNVSKSQDDLYTNAIEKARKYAEKREIKLDYADNGYYKILNRILIESNIEPTSSEINSIHGKISKNLIKRATALNIENAETLPLKRLIKNIRKMEGEFSQDVRHRLLAQAEIAGVENAESFDNQGLRNQIISLQSSDDFQSQQPSERSEIKLLPFEESVLLQRKTQLEQFSDEKLAEIAGVVKSKEKMIKKILKREIKELKEIRVEKNDVKTMIKELDLDKSFRDIVEEEQRERLEKWAEENPKHLKWVAIKKNIDPDLPVKQLIDKLLLQGRGKEYFANQSLGNCVENLSEGAWLKNVNILSMWICLPRRQDINENYIPSSIGKYVMKHIPFIKTTIGEAIGRRKNLFWYRTNTSFYKLMCSSRLTQIGTTFIVENVSLSTPLKLMVGYVINGNVEIIKTYGNSFGEIPINDKNIPFVVNQEKEVDGKRKRKGKEISTSPVFLLQDENIFEKLTNFMRDRKREKENKIAFI